MLEDEFFNEKSIIMCGIINLEQTLKDKTA